MLHIGNTPLLKLEHITEPGSADIYVKYEGANPTGTTSGANVWAAIRRAKILGPGKKIVTVIVGTGLKYLDGELFRY